MGQIVFNNQKPKYCKLQAIRPGGQHVNDDVALNEVWLVDTTNSQKSETGTGEYDAYIIGDGNLKAGQLPLHYLPKMGDIPTNLSQLSEDTNHQTVSQTEKDVWNAGGAGEIVNNVDNEDLTSVEIAEDVRVIKFKDKEYNSSNYSGYGKTYLRKNYVTELERRIIDITPAVGTDEEDPSEDPEETAEKIKNYYVNLGAGIDGTAVITSRVNVGYLRKEVFPGDVLYFQAYTKGSVSGWFYGIIDKTTNQIYYREGNYPEEAVTQHEGYVSIELPEGVESAYLVVNIVTYDNPIYSIKKAKKLDTEKEFNILSSVIGNNTIFEVNYDYDLNYRVIALPENSVLKFNGGSIKNAIIFGNNTTIIADSNNNIFGRNTEILGTWKTNTWYAKWFGVYADGVRDDTPVLQRMLEIAIKTGSKNVILNWYDCTFRTTKGLFIRDYTTILGGAIKAKFDNPLDWVLQTYSLYNGTKVVRYNGLLAYDEGRPTWGGFIKDLSIRGELNYNGDGTWSPIFGGIRLMTTSMQTENVTIKDVGYGMARAATVVSRDTNLCSFCYFAAYLTNYVINLEVNTAYFQAHAHTTSSGPNDPYKVIPFTREYQPIDSEGKTFMSYGDVYIDGNGGIDDTDAEHPRPKFAAYKANQTSAVFNNVAMDMYQDIGYAVGDFCFIKFVNTRFEAVGKCFLYLGGEIEYITLDTVTTSLSEPEYDIYQKNGVVSSVVNLIAAPGITCMNTGNSNETAHKLYHANGRPLQINVFGPRTNYYPDDKVFCFIDYNNSINLVPDGYENMYSLGNGKYVPVANIQGSTYKKFTINANTIVSAPVDAVTFYKEGVVIVGESRTTSVLKLNGLFTLDNSGNSPATAEFRNLTIDCTNGKFRTLHQTYAYGTGAKLTFIDCNIICANDSFIYGDSMSTNYSDGSILTDVKLQGCNIYSKSSAIISAGNIRFFRNVLGPSIRWGYTNDAGIRNSNVLFYKKGSTSNRKLITYHLGKGYTFANTETGRTETWNGRQWVLDDGYPYTESRGNTANTPALPLMKIGTEYNDTTEGVKKVLTANGTCGYGTFAFNAVFPISTNTFYIGTTAVTPDSNGAFSVNLPTGTYPVYCPGYDCYPASVTIADNSTIAIYQKTSKFTSTFIVTIYAKNDNDEIVTDLVIKVGGRTATVPSGKNYYQVNLPTGDYQIMAEGYADQIPLKVNGLAVTTEAVFSTEASTDTVVLNGYLYDHDHICDNNGTNVVAGKYNVSVDSTSLEVSVTDTDLSTILYFVDDAISNVNKQLACLLMKRWFEAGHYGELSGNNVKLYSDTVGSTTGNAATFTDTSTNLVCTVTHTAGTNATWENAQSGSSSDSSMNIVAASGTSLTANANTYYTFAAAVNTLAVTLPAMTDVTSVKALCLAFTAGATPQITFTSADSKTVAFYDTYDIDAECEYEVTCLYNGTKWIVSSALIS